MPMMRNWCAFTSPRHARDEPGHDELGSAGLKALNEVPHITGRTATYIFRQLNDMKTGNRSGALVELMKPVVAKLDQDDTIALAAFLGSQAP
jgi:cytochrome c553